MKAIAGKFLVGFGVLILSLCIRATNVEGQFSPLSVGDRLPDYRIGALINHPAKTAKLSDFRNKLLIIEFWSTWCKGCVDSWPKLLSLQQKFNEKIQILLVNPWEDEKVIRSLIKRQRESRGVGMTLPMVCNDTILKQLFPTSVVPHVIWVDQSGYIRSITDGTQVTEWVIEAILAKKELLIPQARGFNDYTQYRDSAQVDDPFRPLLVGGNGNPGKYLPLLSQSILVGNIPGIWPWRNGLVRDSDGWITFSTLNFPVKEIYKRAYNDQNFNSVVDRGGKKAIGLDPLLDNRIVWSVRDPIFTAKTDAGTLDPGQYYSYQLTVPDSIAMDRIKFLVRSDLQKYFGLKAHWEKRRTKCLVFQTLDSVLAKSTGNESKFFNNPKTGRVVWGKVDGGKSDISSLIKYLERVPEYSTRSPFPLVDEMTYKGPIGGFELYENYTELDKSLRKFGLRVLVLDREINMLIVQEPDNYVFPEELKYINNTGNLEWIYSDQ